MFSFFKRYLFRLDIYLDEVSERFTRGNGVGCVFYGRLENPLGLGISICRENLADQSIGFVGAWRCPTDQSEKVIISDRVVEICLLKAGRCILRFPLRRAICEPSLRHRSPIDFSLCFYPHLCVSGCRCYFGSFCQSHKNGETNPILMNTIRFRHLRDMTFSVEKRKPPM